MATATARPTESASPGFNEKMLFWASFLTLIAAGIGFSVRAAILKDWGQQFGFTQSELGGITGGGLFGFGMTIIVLSFIADSVGYGRLMVLAFALYILSAIVTFAATPVFASTGRKDLAYWCLFIGAWLFSLANGTCETVINPLTATLFPRNKTHWLNILHAGWPGGLILGALVTLGFNKYGGGDTGNIRWEFKLGVFLIPVLLFGLMMLGRRFPKSEAASRDVSVKDMMGEIGFLGVGVVIFFLGMLLTTVILPAIPESWVKMDEQTIWGVGWGTALVVWLIYAVASGFRLGHFVLAVLYVLHALVGYVELGTDSWITNIGTEILTGSEALSSENQALIAFIWTNFLMFSLRFFAGPIVHKISPLGLLFVSSLLGTAGLVLFSQPFINSFLLWLVVSTIYAIGKTFYWPTLLGVISERYPRGGALALGFSGGIGMLSAGLLGGPGIGYKQDYFAVQYLQKNLQRPDTYARYVARKDTNELDDKGFPLLSDLMPDTLPKVAGLDNSKVGILKEYEQVKAGNLKETTLERDLRLVNAEKEPQLFKSLEAAMNWWKREGEPNFNSDLGPVKEAKLYGARTALLYTAVVPAAMALGFRLLILIFRLQGGYRQVHIDDHGH